MWVRSLDGEEPMALDAEIRYFEAHKQDLLRHHEGKFALVVGERLIGVFDAPEEAYKAGLAQVGNRPMLIKQVLRDEPTQSAPALALGLLGARL
jgi:hypothetical protein